MQRADQHVAIKSFININQNLRIMNKVFFYLHEAIRTAKELSSQAPIFVCKTKDGYILDFEVKDNWVCKVTNSVDDVELNLLRFLG